MKKTGDDEHATQPWMKNLWDAYSDHSGTEKDLGERRKNNFSGSF